MKDICVMTVPSTTFVEALRGNTLDFWEFPIEISSILNADCTLLIKAGKAGLSAGTHAFDLANSDGASIIN